jgi:receptor protein-tyrosine kinase
VNTSETLTALRTGWYLLLIGVLVSAALAVVADGTATPVYEASASYVVSPGSDIALDDVAQGVNTLEASRSRSIMTTLTQITDSDLVVGEAFAALGLDPALRDTYEVKSLVVPEANVMETAVTGPDPEVAAALASTIGELGGSRFVALYQIYDIQVLDAATVPTDTANTGLKKILVVAIFIGLVIGAGVALLRAAWMQRSDRTMRTRLGAYDRPATPIESHGRFKRVG